MELTPDELRSLSYFLSELARAANGNGVEAAADTAMSIQMPGWPHSLNVHRKRAEDGTHTYVLGVGSDY